MSKTTLIRAWKDEEYRLSLSEAIESPVGSLEVTDADLELVVGSGRRHGGGVVICNITFVGRCGETVSRCGVTICAGSCHTTS
jgi:mersacidin/lichenicidin family type 2 lantibiotic